MEGEKIFGSQNYFNLILKRECKGAVCRECEADCLADLVPPPGRQPGGGGVMCGAAAAARGPGQRVAAFSFYGESDTGYWRGIRGNLDLLQVQRHHGAVLTAVLGVGCTEVLPRLGDATVPGRGGAGQQLQPAAVQSTVHQQVQQFSDVSVSYCLQTV